MALAQNTAGGIPNTTDIESSSIDVTIITRPDMVVASTMTIHNRYFTNTSDSVRGQSTPYMWVSKVIGKNASDETIFIKTTYVGKNRPKGLPESAVLEDVII